MASQTEKKKRGGKQASPGTSKATDVEVEKNGKKSAGPNGRSVDVPDVLEIHASARTYHADAYRHDQLGLSEEKLLAMYRNMLLQRRFEERAAQMYGKQKIAGFLHLYIGQEAVSTGAAAAMELGKDTVITAYRDHGLGLALGMGANESMAELYGRIGGSSRGKGGSMHFFDREKGMYGGHGIVGAHIPVATGIAFAHKYKEDGGVCLCFFGDGAVGQGAFHEAANLAALWELPLVLVIENNQYAMGTAVHRAFAEPEFFKQAIGYGMESSMVHGMDVLTTTRAFQDHIAMARENKPSLMEIRTYRYRGHSMSDPAKYRTKEELERRKDEDPIIRLKKYLLDNRLGTNDSLDQVDEEVKNEVMESVEFAENSPFPPTESIYEDVYTQKDYPFLTN
ncbi:MAG TPA: pyruvate dehydrogenase (acetyl-transferring) E1 component subunit alpha [Rhodothermales bacterium]